MRATPKCIDVAPQGDLVVAVDSDPARRLAKISSTIIKPASPVFRAMLGPSFKEGQATHDASNPLSLPDDDAISMLNLFHILHYNGDKAKKTEDDWIQKLVVVCDKYECTESLKTYLHFQLSQCSFVSTLDRFIISGLIDDRSRFERLSEQIVRMPKHQAQFAAHQGILHLSPANMLGKFSHNKYICVSNDHRQDEGIPSKGTHCVSRPSRPAHHESILLRLYRRPRIVSRTQTAITAY